MAKDTKRPRSGGNASKGGSSLMAGLLVGLVIGIAAAVGVAMYINRGANPFSSKANSGPQAQSTPPAQPQAPKAPEVLRPATSKDEAPVQIASTPSASAPAQRASGTDRFDFYEVLPGLTDKGSKEAKAAPPKREASPPAKVEPPKAAWLQAGAFQNEQDADNLKAKLALIGVEARIQTQDIPGKGLWHRVRIGPFNNSADVDKARAQLQGNGIESTVVKAN